MRPNRSIIAETGTRAVFHTILLFSLYLLFAGHDQPGGGFIGGLVAGAAFVLYYVSYDAKAMDELVRVRAEALLGSGILLAGGTGAAGLVAASSLLEAGYVYHAHVGVLGEVGLHSTLFFDIGVYLVVVGLVRMVLRSLGAERPAYEIESPDDEQAADGRQPAEDPA